MSGEHSAQDTSQPEPAPSDGGQPAAPIPPSVEERRREYRLNRVLGAELTQGEEIVRARLFVINISRTGMKATNHFRVSEEHEQEVRLFIGPKEPPIEMRAKVAWQKELTTSGMFEIGFAFSEISPDMSARLQKFIDTERHKNEKAPGVDTASVWKLLSRHFD